MEDKPKAIEIELNDKLSEFFSNLNAKEKYLLHQKDESSPVTCINFSLDHTFKKIYFTVFNSHEDSIIEEYQAIDGKIDFFILDDPGRFRRFLTIIDEDTSYEIKKVINIGKLIYTLRGEIWKK